MPLQYLGGKKDFNTQRLLTIPSHYQESAILTITYSKMEKTVEPEQHAIDRQKTALIDKQKHTFRTMWFPRFYFSATLHV